MSTETSNHISDLPSLVVAAQTGDQDAFSHLVHRFQDMAVGYAYSIIGDFHLAEDAAQEAFVGAWINLPRLRDPNAFPGWFRRMVFMRCTRFTRKMRSNTTSLSEDISEIPDRTDVERRAKTEEKIALYRVLASLDLEEPMAITLFYISQYTHADIAVFLDLSPDTVNNRLRSARRNIKEGLENMDELKKKAPSRNDTFANTVARLTRPLSMDAERYIYGTEVVNGHDAWAMFSACAAGDLARVQALTERDPALVNAQHWYQFPLHMAGREGHADVVQYLLEHGADLGKSRFLYNSWDKLLSEIDRRGHLAVRKLIEAALRERFNFHPEFIAVRDAIKAQEIDKVEILIAEDPELATASDALGNTGLHWAVLTRQIQLIDRFLKLRVSIEAKRADGQTPAMLSANGDYWYRWYRDLPEGAMQNQWVITGYLLAKGAEVTLSLACAMGDLGRVEEILGSDPQAANRLDTQGASPLYHAARSESAKVISTLLAHGADSNQPEHLAPHGRALHEAAGMNNIEIARMLLDAGANPNGASDSSGNVLYINRAKNPDDCEAMQELLLSHGAYNAPYSLSDEELKEAILNDSPVIRDDQYTHEVLGREDPELIDIFVAKHGEMISRISPTDIWGGNVPPGDIVRKLIDHGLEINRPNWIGRTFLHVCAKTGRVDTAEVLLDSGADIDALDLEHGGTPLAEAAREGQTEMVKFFLDRGANPNLPEESDWAKPRTWAEEKGHSEIADLIKRYSS